MTNLRNIVEQIPSASILCVGDIMLDRYVYGAVERVSPEAPVPVLKWKSEKDVCGGVGNVAINLRSLGAKVSLLARIGKDAAGDEVRRILEENGVRTGFAVSETAPTTLKTRFVCGHNHMLRVDRELVAPLSPEEEEAAMAEADKLLAEASLVIISDYAKGFLTKRLLAHVIGRCRELGLPSLVDPKGSDYTKYAGATLVKPNRKELELVSGRKFDPAGADFIPSVAAAARELISGIDAGHAVVTLSEHGMLHVRKPGAGEAKGADPLHLKVEAREVYDVSGAGDTTIAVLGAALASKAGIAGAMALANLAAGIVVGKVGTSTVSLDELRSAVGNLHGNAPFSRKILSLAQLKAQVESWQKDGLKVGFTNGCFDCLHAGHLSSIAQAKELCDRLVVAVNSDASVKRNKGPTRPIQDENTRSLVLAGLEAVDAVVIFGENTAMEVVEAIRPDVIAKEGYTVENWPEARFVASYGGEVATLSRLEGYSTTNMLGRLAK